MISEAVRNPAHCEHVKNPSPPVILHGSETALRESIETYCKNTKTAKGRKLRSDALVLGCFVASYPEKIPGDDYEDWQRKSLEFAQIKWGHRVRFAVCHRDESNPHLHIFLVEDAGTEFRLDPVKDAHRRATEAARASGKNDQQASLREKNKMAIAAGEALSREYFEKVSRHFGHEKDSGEKARRRKSREQYQAEQDAIRALETSKIEAEDVIRKAQTEASNLMNLELEKLETLKHQEIAALDTIAKGSKVADDLAKVKVIYQKAKREKSEAVAIKKSVDAADPYKLKRTIGKFAIQLMLRMIAFFSSVIRRPRNSHVRQRLLELRARFESHKTRTLRLEHQIQVLTKSRADEFNARKQAERRIEQLTKQAESLAAAARPSLENQSSNGTLGPRGSSSSSPRKQGQPGL